MRTLNFLPVLLLSLFLAFCGEKGKEMGGKMAENAVVATKEMARPDFQNKGHEMIYEFVQKVGNHDKLTAKKDVVYTYKYQTPDGKSDITTEKYLFADELSYAAFKTHERTLPKLEGDIEQGYDGEDYWVKNNGDMVEDEEAVKHAAFIRPTNYYWFAMNQKLLDPGLNYEYIAEKEVDGITYDVVKISFKPADDPSDVYQVYINKKTGLVDQFLFTVVDFGVVEKPMLMKVKYETVDGLMIATDRKYKMSTWEADVDDKPWISVKWSDIKFNNGLTPEDFKA